MKTLLFFLASGVLFAQNTVTIDGNISDWSDEVLILDLGGCNDNPGQKDVIVSGLAVNNPIVYYLFVFDETGLSGGNTGDGCWLFDTNSDGNADKAFCFTLRNNPFTLLAADVKFYDCNNTDPDRCTGATEIMVTSLNCALHGMAPEIAGFECGDGDTAAVECSMDITEELGWMTGNLVLLAACSYPSQIPNSAPSDCVVELSDNVFVLDPENGTVPVILQSFSIDEER